MGYPYIQKIATGLPYIQSMSIAQFGSDEFSEELRRDRAGVTHKRYGVTVGSRKWKDVRVWKLNLNTATQETISVLQVFFKLGTFYLIPDSDFPATYYTVYWEDDSFSPRYIAPNQYSVQATFKEV